MESDGGESNGADDDSAFGSSNGHTERSSLLVTVRRHDHHQQQNPWGKVKRFFIFTILWLVYLVISVAYSVISPFYPQEAQKYGVGSLGVGLIVGVSPLCVAILSPILGYFIPRIGLKFMLVSGCLLVGGPFILMGYLTAMPTKFEFILFSALLRFVEGIGSAGCDTSLFTIAGILYPDSTGTAMGILEVGSGIGFMVGPPLGGLLYNVGGFKLPFIVTGGLILLFVPLFLLMIPSTSGKRQAIPPATLFKLLKNIPFMMIGLDNIIIIAAMLFFTPILAPFLKEQFKLTELGIGLVFICGALPYVLSSFAAGKLSDVLGSNSRYLIVSGLFITGVSFIFIAPANFIELKCYLWLTCVAFGVIGAGVGLGVVPIYPHMLDIARAIDPATDYETMSGIISGITASTWCFGEFIGPVIGGTLTQLLTFQLSTNIFGVVLIAKGFVLFGVTMIDRFMNSSSRSVTDHHQ